MRPDGVRTATGIFAVTCKNHVNGINQSIIIIVIIGKIYIRIRKVYRLCSKFPRSYVITIYIISSIIGHVVTGSKWTGNVHRKIELVVRIFQVVIFYAPGGSSGGVTYLIERLLNSACVFTKALSVNPIRIHISLRFIVVGKAFNSKSL